MAEVSAIEQPATPAADAAVGVPTEAATKAPAVVAAAKAPASGVADEEAQPEPLLASDVSGSASNISESETEDKAGAREVEEEEDLFASSTDKGTDDAPDDVVG